MGNEILKAVFCILVLLGLSGTATAEARNPFQIKLTAATVVVVDGKEVLQPATRVKPGDVVEYKAVYRNPGKLAKQVVATLPLPAGTEYQPGSVAPKTAKASLDGKTYADIPLKRQVKLPDGKLVERAVPYSEYRFVQWNLGDLAQDASSTVSARVKVSTAQ